MRKEVILIEPTESYLRVMYQDMQVLSDGKDRLYPPFMRIGEEGWTTDWDNSFTSLSKRSGGTRDVLVVKVAHNILEAYYPSEKPYRPHSDYYVDCRNQYYRDLEHLEDRIYSRVMASIKDMLSKVLR